MSELEKVLHRIYEHELKLEPSGPPQPCGFPGCVLSDFHEGDHQIPPRGFPRPFSAQENHDRLAAAQTSYGVGTRSYNRSAAKREVDRQREAATAQFEAEPKSEVPIPREWMMCRCGQRRYAHPLSVHLNLRQESWHPDCPRVWPWSLCLSDRLELSAERKAA